MRAIKGTRNSDNMLTIIMNCLVVSLEILMTRVCGGGGEDMQRRDTLLRLHIPHLQPITVTTAGMEVGVTTGSQTSHQVGQSLRLAVCG